MGFRIAIGDGRCASGMKRRDPVVRELCSRILARITQLLELSPDSLRSLPERLDRECLDNDYVAHFSFSREVLASGETLVVVQGFVPSWRYPNHIGYAGIGHMFAEGVVVDEKGIVREAEDALLWPYR